MWSVDYSYEDAKMHKSGSVQPLLSSNINSEWTGFQTRLFFRRGQKRNTQRKLNSIIVFLFIQNNPSFKNKLKHAYLHRSIDVKFIFNCLFIGKFRRLFSSVNILQNSRCRPLSCFLAVLSMSQPKERILYIPWCTASYYIIKLPNAGDPISSTGTRQLNKGGKRRVWPMRPSVPLLCRSIYNFRCNIPNISFVKSKRLFWPSILVN